MSQRLYPPAPELAQGDELSRAIPARSRMRPSLTAMPAWGKTHDDELIWDMGAFIRQLPKLNAQQYKAALTSAPEDHDEMMKDMGNSK